MRLTQHLPRTAKEAPKQAPTLSLRLLLQAGYVREAGPGLFAAMPLFQRVLVRLADQLRSELVKSGAQELALPALQPADATSTEDSSGYDGLAAGSCFQLKDQRGVGLRLGSSPEALLLRLAAKEISSYKHLPRLVFQIRPAYREDFRPKTGLAAAREYLALQSWSLAADASELDQAHQHLLSAWKKLAGQLGLAWTATETTPAGERAGSTFHRIVIPSDGGAEKVLACPTCGYAATTEWAASRLTAFPQDPEQREQEAVFGPGLVQVEPLAEFIGIPVWKTTKTLLFIADERPVAVMLRGDSDASEAKLRRFLRCRRLELAHALVVGDLTGADVGYAGPIGLPPEVTVLADLETKARVNFECGANRTDYHFINVNFGRDLARPTFGDFKQAAAGHHCPVCDDGVLSSWAGLAVGETVKWGEVHPAAGEANFLDREGKSHPVHLSACAIDLVALAAVVVEKNHDVRGIIWPVAAAPFVVHLVGLNPEDEAVTRSVEELYRLLWAEGVPTLVDDRDARAGDKFADADLLGLPVRLTISRRTLPAGQLEIAFRQSGEKTVLPRQEALARVRDFWK